VAVACLLGVPAERLVYGDSVERLYWSAVAARAVALDELRRDNQATANANQIGELLRRMFRRRGGRRA
jgi:hypothetical protein